MTVRVFEIQQPSVLYYILKADFKSAYKSNGNNKELALSQIAQYRKMEKEKIRTVLLNYLKNIK